jgi:hypothetical protein
MKSSRNLDSWEEPVLVYRPEIYPMVRRRGMQDADAQDITRAVLGRDTVARAGAVLLIARCHGTLATARHRTHTIVV